GMITDAIEQILAKDEQPLLLNLASKEYFSAVQSKTLSAEVITPVFKDQKNGRHKIISFYAKKARGLMAAYIIKNRLRDVEEIKAFNSDGYYYCPEQSTASEWLFLRDEVLVE
ncbi:MAG: peroxide stress protein YaaA, partial [Spongiibacteraceae bacterium]